MTIDATEAISTLLRVEAALASAGARVGPSDDASRLLQLGEAAQRVASSLIQLGEAAERMERGANELVATREAVGEAWLSGGATLADAIRAKTEALEATLVDTETKRRADAIYGAAFVHEFYEAARFGRGPQVDPESIARFSEEAQAVTELWLEHVASSGDGDPEPGTQGTVTGDQP